MTPKTLLSGGSLGGAASGPIAFADGEFEREGSAIMENSGGNITIGGGTGDLSESISSTVGNAVSGIATNSSASGGTSVERNEISLGEQEGVAIADASGGNNNLSFVS